MSELRKYRKTFRLLTLLLLVFVAEPFGCSKKEDLTVAKKSDNASVRADDPRYVERSLARFLRKGGCSAQTAGCNVMLTANIMDQDLHDLESALGGQHVEYLFYPGCKYEVADTFLRRITQIEQTTDARYSPSKGDQALRKYQTEGWFEQAKQIWILCMESCSSAHSCGEDFKNAQDGDLSKLRCQRLVNYLENSLHVAEDKIVYFPIACDHKRERNSAVRAADQRAMLLFLRVRVDPKDVVSKIEGSGK